MSGAKSIGERFNITQELQPPLIVFDEIHKYPNWENFLKGFIDLYKGKAHVIVTGSSRLDVYRTGQDSLMGRYFLYRIHPLTVAEVLNNSSSTQEISQPQKIPQDNIDKLLTYSGFPEPYVNADGIFYARWNRLKREQLFREDVRDLTGINDVAQLEVLSELLRQQVRQLLNVSSLARKIGASSVTVAKWLQTLQAFYHCFVVKPWSQNVTRSLLKDPKIYLWNWAGVQDQGMRYENFIASHLLKAVHFWTDLGFGEYDLYFLRNKDTVEVDFLVTKNNQPWFMVEAKLSDNQCVNSGLHIFQEQIKAPHAFQVVLNSDYVEKDCFSYSGPVVVPAATFLSQLV